MVLLVGMMRMSAFGFWHFFNQSTIISSFLFHYFETILQTSGSKLLGGLLYEITNEVADQFTRAFAFSAIGQLGCSFANMQVSDF